MARSRTRHTVKTETPRDRLRIVLVGVLVVTAPAFTLLTAYAVLRATGSAVGAGLTPLEVAELYAVETAAFAVFAYLLYRLALRGVRGE
jgi:hypothetical protein